MNPDRSTWLRLYAAAAITLGTLLLTGCVRPSMTGERTTVVPAPGGGAKVTEDGDTVKIEAQTADGERVTATYGADVKESEMGVPVYPGAGPKGESAMRRSTSPAGTSVTGSFLTPDAPSKVVDFYADKVTVQQKLEVGGRGMLSGTLADGRQVTVMASPAREGGGTEIVIAVLDNK